MVRKIGTRKKKPTRKYTPRHEIRVNTSKDAANHPQYVFGEKGNRYVAFGLTTHPKKKFKHSKLNVNPNPVDKRDSYIQYKVFHTQKEYYTEPLKNWKISDSDMPLVRHMKKQYKKRQNKSKKK